MLVRFINRKSIRKTMMKELFIEQTPKTPQIELNQLTGDIIFSGKSIPENAAKIYEPVLNWVNEYILKARTTTNFRLNLEYFNTASSIWLKKILKTLLRISEPDYVLILHLYLPIEDYDEMDDFDDIKDAFFPISDIDHGVIPSIGIKLYGLDDKGAIIRDKLIFIGFEQSANLKLTE
jgi:SiaC family regulatory phosphoprotein